MNAKNDDIVMLVRSWFIKAEEDLWMAEMAVSRPEAPGDLISFHAQQCAEKYLKGALVFLQIEFPKTHNLRTLLDLIGPSWPEMPFSAGEVVRLTQYAVSLRYPDEWQEVSHAEASEAVKMAKRVREAVRAFLKARGWKDAQES